MKTIVGYLTSLFVVGILSLSMAAQTSAGRYDGAIQTKVSQEFAKKAEFRNLQASVEDGIVTLTGSVDLYQQKLDAARQARKADHVQGVRNLVAVGTTVPDDKLTAQIDRKLYYDRMGYDNAFNFVTVSVKDGAATLNGETRTDISRNSAVQIANNMPGVKDVVDNIAVAPVSGLDDQIRRHAARAIYRDPVLSRYALDPAHPIRIVVDRGQLSLYGVVANTSDKNIAGIRASQVFGVFKVQNNLEVEKKS